MVNNTVIQPWFRACKPVVIFCFSIGFIIGGVVSVFLVNALLDSQISIKFVEIDRTCVKVSVSGSYEENNQRLHGSYLKLPQTEWCDASHPSYKLVNGASYVYYWRNTQSWKINYKHCYDIKNVIMGLTSTMVTAVPDMHIIYDPFIMNVTWFEVVRNNTFFNEDMGIKCWNSHISENENYCDIIEVHGINNSEVKSYAGNYSSLPIEEWCTDENGTDAGTYPYVTYQQMGGVQYLFYTMFLSINIWLIDPDKCFKQPEISANRSLSNGYDPTSYGRIWFENGGNYAYDNSEIEVACSIFSHNTYRISLSEGVHGRVDISIHNVTGSVCDDSWGEVECQVVCRELGMSGGVSYSKSFFGDAYNGKIWLDNVECAGTEKTLQECAHNGWGVSNCGKMEAAGCSCLIRGKCSKIESDANEICNMNSPESYGHGTSSSTNVILSCGGFIFMTLCVILSRIDCDLIN